MAPLRVVYFVSYYLDFKGSQKSLLVFLRGLRDGVSPHVVFPGHGPCVEAYRDAGLSVEVLPAPPRVDTFGGGLLRTNAAERALLLARDLVPYGARFAGVLRREAADIAHFNDTRSMLLAGLGATFARVPKVWHVRGDERGLGALSVIAAAMADLTLCVAEGVRRTVPAPFRHKCRTVYNGVTPPADAPRRDRAGLAAGLAEPLRLADDAVVAVVAGSIVPFKGIHHVIEALARIGETRSDAARRLALVFVGDAPYPDYEADVRAAASRVPNVAIRFAGWDDEPLDWIRAADVVVLPTLEREQLAIRGHARLIFGSEGFSRTVLEAMACAKPVIATRVAGVPEQVIDGVTGFLCAPSDPAALALALVRFVEMAPGERVAMGEAGRDRVVSRFSVQQNVDATVAAYRELVPG
jgi:glycosyltransferase involved in cell wall biosynthesis